MGTLKKQARFAGVLYFVMGIPAVFSLIYVPSTLIVRGNPTATASKILASEMLFRTGMVGELVNATGCEFVAWALYRLFIGVDKSLASKIAPLYASPCLSPS